MLFLKFILKYLIFSVLIIISILLVVSLFTLLERKLLGGIQRRHGPVFTGFFGLLQPFADGLKLFLKEIMVPAGGYYYVFLGASVFSLVLSLLSWSVIPFNSKFVIADINLGLFFILLVSSLNVYSTLFSGWSSNSKYGLLGSIRSGAQMISYELPMTLSLIPIIFTVSSMNLTNIVNYQNMFGSFLFFAPSCFVFFITALAETNRTPFDLPEAESELVSGYNIEYSSIPFAFFFLAEYNHILVMSFLFSILYLGGWSHSFSNINNSLVFETFILTVKSFFVVNLFIYVRGVVPRYKYMQLIKMCWTVFIPFLLFYIMVCLYYYSMLLINESERYLVSEDFLLNKDFNNTYEGIPITEQELQHYYKLFFFNDITDFMNYYGDRLYYKNGVYYRVYNEREIILSKFIEKYDPTFPPTGSTYAEIDAWLNANPLSEEMHDFKNLNF